MTGVSVAGVGITRFGSLGDMRMAEIAAPAVAAALSMADVDPADVDEVFVANSFGGPASATKVARQLGFGGVTVNRVDEACASGAGALRLAADAVAAGRRDCVLVLGLEQMPKGLLEPRGESRYGSALGLDNLPLLHAFKTQQYLRHIGATVDDLARVAQKARERARLAPHAKFFGATVPSVADIAASMPISDPLTKEHCCRNADGAAAVILVPQSSTSRLIIPAWLSGTYVEDVAVPMSGGSDSREQVVRELSGALYERSGVGPEQIGFLQVNDAFTVAEPLYLEALGFAEGGDGLAQSLREAEGETSFVVNSDGGLLGRGHSMGATGVAMLYELTIQMLGLAGERQVQSGLSHGLVQSHGAGGEELLLLERKW